MRLSSVSVRHTHFPMMDRCAVGLYVIVAAEVKLGTAEAMQAKFPSVGSHQCFSSTKAVHAWLFGEEELKF